MIRKTHEYLCRNSAFCRCDTPPEQDSVLRELIGWIWITSGDHKIES